MPRRSKKTPYCFNHDRQLTQIRQIDKTVSDICEPLSSDFVPATALTQSLVRTFRAVAEGRFDSKSASALVRVASILLKSIDASSAEFQSCFVEGYWRQLIARCYQDLPDYVPPKPRRPRRRTPSSSTPDSESE